MNILPHPFQTINWNKIEKIKYSGEKGFALWQTKMMGDIRIRMVEYSAGYVADHWCSKGHVIYCIKGKMTTELKDGRKMKLKKGMTYHVGDESEAHRSASKKGCNFLSWISFRQRLSNWCIIIFAKMFNFFSSIFMR